MAQIDRHVMYRAQTHEAVAALEIDRHDALRETARLRRELSDERARRAELKRRIAMGIAAPDKKSSDLALRGLLLIDID
ncbi:MAG: hypothetical protein GY851_09395 [bacterium]|nr:hypothetical protein [bacterium]